MSSSSLIPNGRARVSRRCSNSSHSTSQHRILVGNQPRRFLVKNPRNSPLPTPHCSRTKSQGGISKIQSRSPILSTRNSSFFIPRLHPSGFNRASVYSRLNSRSCPPPVVQVDYSRKFLQSNIKYVCGLING